MSIIFPLPIYFPVYHFSPHLPVVINVVIGIQLVICLVLSSGCIWKWVFAASVKGPFGINTENTVMSYSLCEAFPSNSSSFYKVIFKVKILKESSFANSSYSSLDFHLFHVLLDS